MADTLLDSKRGICHNSVMQKALLLIVVTLLVPAAAYAQEWKLDSVPLKNGSTLEGLIVEEDRETILLKHIVRKPGSPTFVFEIMISKDEVDLKKIVRLSDAERKQLAKRIDQLDQGGKREQSRMRDLALESIAFGKGKGWRYTSKYFVLETNLREDVARQLTVRLEDIFAAYDARLGGKKQPKELTKITLYRSMEEYLKAVQDARLNILNPAFYDPAGNRIVAGSALDQQAEDLEKLRKKHDGILAELDDQEKKMRRHYHGQPPNGLLSQLWQARRNVLAVNADNADTFEAMKRPLLALLYHEAFHAYLDNFVYPTAEMSVPRWLNEGLAQVFETAIVEAGELRVGHIPAKRFERIQEALKKKQLVPLKELLTAGAKPFSVHDLSDKQVADRHYLTSWAVAYYLLFGRKGLTTESLDAYVKAISRGTDPLDAFRDLVDQPLPEFEGEVYEYFGKLRSEAKPGELPSLRQ